MNELPKRPIPEGACGPGYEVVDGSEAFAAIDLAKTGDDARSGRRRGDAFLTIQRGVDALAPGDTLTIGRGEYAEAVSRGTLGGDDADTVIRAEIPGTVTLRGDVAAPEFEKVDGCRFIYAGPFFSTNSNGLMDESGAPGAVDFVQPFFGSGYSVEFDGATWSRQNSPTPNTGPLTPEPSTALCLLLGLCILGWAKRDGSPV